MGRKEETMSWLSRLTERQIQKARIRGDLDGLAGEGAPLPDRPEQAFITAGEAVGSRIMAEAGVLPEEITLKKQVAAQLAERASHRSCRAQGRHGRACPPADAPADPRGGPAQVSARLISGEPRLRACPAPPA